MRCLRCDDFLQTAKFKWVHNLLKHYTRWKNISPEDRTIEVQRLGNIKICRISLVQHNAFYDFENSDEIRDSFLNDVRSSFFPVWLVSIKCDFSIENYQLANLEFWLAV